MSAESPSQPRPLPKLEAAPPPPMMVPDTARTTEGYEVERQIPKILEKIRNERTEFDEFVASLQRIRATYESKEPRAREETVFLASVKAAVSDLEGTYEAGIGESSKEPATELFDRAEELAKNGMLLEAERLLVVIATRVSLEAERIATAYEAIRTDEKPENGRVSATARS